MREPRVGALFLFRGEALLDGDSGVIICVLCSGSNISEGSTFSLAKIFLVRPPVRGVFETEFVVFRLDTGAFRGLRFVAGAKSSTLSSFILDSMSSSSSSDSTTTFLRAAALLDGRTGDSDIVEFDVVGNFVYGPYCCPANRAQTGDAPVETEYQAIRNKADSEKALVFRIN